MGLTSFLWIDWVITGIIMVSALISLRRGFFKEALSLVIWFLAIMISMIFHEQMAILLQDYIESPSLRKVSAIVILFVICLLAGGMFSLLMSQLIKITGLSGTDRLLGMIFGALRGVTVVVIALLIGQRALPIQQEVWWQESVLIPHMMRLENWIIQFTDAIRNIISPLFA